MRRDESASGFANAFVAASRGAQPERTNVTVSAGGAGAMRRDEDAAAVIAVVAAVAVGTAATDVTPPSPRSVWNVGPAQSATVLGPHAWWASGLQR